MLVPGPQETLRILDGSDQHAEVRALEGWKGTVAFAAPALAYAADAIAQTEPPDRLRLQNRLEDVIVQAQEPIELGRGTAGPRLMILPFDRTHARAFPSLRLALGTLKIGPLMLQTLTIVHLADAQILLERSAAHDAVVTTLNAAGLHVAAAWA